MQIKTVTTAPFDGQNPGTSGLRKKAAVFAAPHYAANFIQSVFNAAGSLRGKILVIGGDGRYLNSEIIQTALKMALAAGAAKIMVGQRGILSTPAVSHLIRKYQAAGGLILSASHNPGGPDADFGIKYNIANGGPAPEAVTQAIFAETQTISSYKIADIADIDIGRLGARPCGGGVVEVVDSVRDYADMMEELFDFAALRKFCAKGFDGAGLKMRFDAMNAVTGPYARVIFEQRLGLPRGTVLRAEPLSDFGGIHPDPNPVYAAELYQLAMAGKVDFAAASDGDGDRNMILGGGVYVAPSDSLALIAAHMRAAKAYKNGVCGIARSMPTGMAADRVAAALGVPLYETPTGWKFFGNLLDSGKVNLCGEESFGTGSGHVREKDGLWAVLMWLNILAATGKSVRSLLEGHWARYGRNYYSRHDYEGVDLAAADKMMADLRARLAEFAGAEIGGLKIRQADDFAYHDPVDGSLTEHQGIRFFLENGGRFIFRLSGTGTQGATVRLYLEHYEADKAKQNLDTQAVLAPLIKLAGTVSQLKQRLKRARPSVIT